MRVYLVDCNGIAHWQWHSTTTDATGHEYDLSEKVTKWWQDFRERTSPTHAVACFDGRGNWRKELYSEYKITRSIKPKDEAKLMALNEMPALWRSFGVRTVAVDGFEADDVIASLAARFSDEAEVIVISTDKDMMQLVEQFGDSPKQYDPRPNRAGECVFYDAKMVGEKMEVPPHRIPELLAMMGDASDDVPGIEGIGRVQAVKAIQQTKTAAEIFRKAEKHQLEAILTKNQDRIVAGKADFDLSLKLVTLRYDVPVDLKLEDTAIKAKEVAA